MNQEWMKIYRDIVCYETDAVRICKSVDEEIAAMIEGMNDMEEMEKWKEHLSSVAFLAEQAGFEIGVRYMMKMLYMS